MNILAKEFAAAATAAGFNEIQTAFLFRYLKSKKPPGRTRERAAAENASRSAQREALAARMRAEGEIKHGAKRRSARRRWDALTPEQRRIATEPMRRAKERVA